MKWRKIIFASAKIISSFIGISMIVWSSYNASLSPTFLGYEGGVVLIVFGGFIWLWERSRKPKVVKKIK